MTAMMAKLELDADRTAYVSVLGQEILRCFVDEDFHYVMEPERRREATEAEIDEIRRRLADGRFERIAALPPVPSLTPGLRHGEVEFLG